MPKCPKCGGFAAGSEQGTVRGGCEAIEQDIKCTKCGFHGKPTVGMLDKAGAMFGLALLDAAIGGQHEFKLVNSSNHIVKVYISEDPEALTKKHATLGMKAAVPGLEAVGLRAEVEMERRGAGREPLVYTINPQKEVAVAVSSYTIFVRAGFFHTSSQAYEVIWENRSFQWQAHVTISFREDQMNVANTWYTDVKPDAKEVPRAGATIPKSKALLPGHHDIPIDKAALTVNCFPEGSQVQVYSGTKAAWVDATVIKSKLGETVVKYAQGDGQKVIKPEDVSKLIRPKGKTVGLHGKGGHDGSPGERHGKGGYNNCAWKVGDTVEVHSQSSGGWVRAAVTAVQPDGSITVTYNGLSKTMSAQQQKGVVRSA